LKINNKDIQRQQFTTGVGQTGANFPLSQNLETESDGEYKVLNVVHIGDTRGNEWFTHVDCVATSTQAGLPFVPSDYTWALGL
jgi:hypothetical protein